jgi:hypothetical protein
MGMALSVLKMQMALSVLKGHGFSRAVNYRKYLGL